MKKIKVILSVLLSIMLLIGCIPAGIVSAEETEDKVYTIFMADPAKMGEAGTNVNAKGASSSYVAAVYDVVTANNDTDGWHYTSTWGYDNSASVWNRFTYFKTGLTNNDLNWIGNNTAIESLKGGLIDVSYKVRITQTVESGSKDSDQKVQFYPGVAQGYTAKNNFAVAFDKVDVVPNGTWQEFSCTPASWKNFYSGFFGYKAEVYPNFVGNVKIDVKDIKFTVKESNREAINTALSGAGVDLDFDDLIAPYFVPEEEPVVGEDMVIYKAKPAKAGTVGTDVSKSLLGKDSKNPVHIAADSEGVYFTYTDEYDNTDRWNRCHIFDLGTNAQTEGHGWMNNGAIFEALAGYVTVSMKARYSATVTSGTTPSNFTYYGRFAFNGAEHGSIHNNNSISGTSGTAQNTWVEITSKPANKLAHMYSGWMDVTATPAPFYGTLTVDMKDITLSINSQDKDAINAAFKAKGITYTFDDLIAPYLNEDSIINPDEASVDTDVIWYANPDRVTSENGGDVTANKASDSPLQFKTENRAIKVYDEDGVYYRTTMNVNGSGGNGDSTILNTNIRKETAGYGWLDNRAVLEKIAPYVNLSLLYRFEGNVPTGGGTPQIYLNGVNGYKRIWQTSVAITNSGQWAEASMKAPNFVLEDPSNGWYDAQVALNLYVYNSNTGFTSTQKIDIRDMRFEFRLSDKVYINRALSEVEGIDNIPNFTEGVEIGTDINGYKDYYSLLVNPVKNATKFDVDDDNALTVKDLIRLKKYESWEIALNAMMIERADANADSVVDTLDIAECRKTLIGK